MTAKVYNLFPVKEDPRDSAPLNHLELTSIYALLAHTAHDQNVSEDTVRATVTTHFGVADVTQLPKKSFDEVIKFLVDLQMDLILN